MTTNVNNNQQQTLTSYNYQQQPLVNDYNSQHIHQQQINNNQILRHIPTFFNQTLPTNQQQVPPTQFHSGFTILDPNIDQNLEQDAHPPMSFNNSRKEVNYDRSRFRH